MAMSAVIGSTASGLDLYLADKLDPMVGMQRANLAGLAIDNIVDFVGQQQLFMGNLRFTGKLTFRFVVSKIITMLAAEILFTYISVRDKTTANMEEHPTGKKLSFSEREKMAALRITINVIVFFTLTYPLRKYWVFIK